MVDETRRKVLSRARYPSGSQPRKTASGHTALADLRSSLAELAYYRSTFFRSNPGALEG
jgi:oligoribonuclease